MMWKVAAWIVLGLIAALATLIALGSARTDRVNRALARDLLEPARVGPMLDATSIAQLPEPVARYLRRALVTDELPRAVRIEQRGEILQAGQWRPFTAVQHVTAQPPGFVWDARVRFAPLVDARVVDAYVDGTGLLEAKLLGLFTVADAGASHALDVSELMRYLAEGPWLPSALLPRDGLTWEPIDDRAARATLTDGDTVAVIDFFFDGDGDVVRIEGDRPRDVDGADPAVGRWIGEFSAYVEQDGVRFPSSGQVSWLGEDGPEPYWRGTTERVEFDPS